MPAECVDRAGTLGFDRATAGAELAKVAGSSPTDPTSYLTRGRLSRRQQVAQAVYAALVQSSRLDADLHAAPAVAVHDPECARITPVPGD
jgi:hypothetical protein